MSPLNAAIPFPEGDTLAYGKFRLCGALKNENSSNSIALKPLKPLLLFNLCNSRITIQNEKPENICFREIHTVFVCKYLNFDMSRGRDVFLDEHNVVAE